MNISRVYTRNVVTVPDSTTLQNAARLMAAHHVGSLLVTEQDGTDCHAVGIVTDRDLVVQAMAAGADPTGTVVAEVMTPRVARIDERADAHQALQRMAELGIRRLAVTRDKAIVGVLSYDDLIDGLAIELADLARIVRQERTREAASPFLEPGITLT